MRLGYLIILIGYWMRFKKATKISLDSFEHKVGLKENRCGKCIECRGLTAAVVR